LRNSTVETPFPRGPKTDGKGFDELRRIAHPSQTPDSLKITEVPLRKLALAHYVHKHQQESASFTVLTEPELSNGLGEAFAPTFIVTFRNAKPQRQYRAVLVNDWDRSVGVDRVQEFKENLQQFDLFHGGEIVSNTFSSQARWLAEREGISLLPRGRLHSEAYRHYRSVKEVERLAGSEHIIRFEEVFPR